ncbi:hypothetical protein DPV73_15560 [Leptospira mayottensis]|nr:hypothetical protein DPV73_15560 [Leptospira mayottensis]
MNNFQLEKAPQRLTSSPRFVRDRQYDPHYGLRHMCFVTSVCGTAQTLEPTPSRANALQGRNVEETLSLDAIVGERHIHVARGREKEEYCIDNIQILYML